MKVTLNNTTYCIKFDHKINTNGKGGITTCTILDPQSKQILVEIKQKCSNKDQYKKVFGRKLALKKALDSIGFSKKERTVVWNQFKEKVHIV